MADRVKLRDIKSLADTHASSLERASLVDAAGRVKLAGVFADDAIRSLGRIDVDGRLTGDGKRDKKGEYAEAKQIEVDKHFEPLLRGLAEHAAAVESELRAAVEPPLPKDANELLRETILGGEIRRRADELADAGVEALWNTGGALVRRALTVMPRITPTKAGTAQVRPYVSEEVVRRTLLEEARAARPDLAAMAENIQAVVGAYRAVHNALKGALQEYVDAAAVGRRLAGNGGGGEAGAFVDPSNGQALPRP